MSASYKVIVSVRLKNVTPGADIEENAEFVFDSVLQASTMLSEIYSILSRAKQFQK